MRYNSTAILLLLFSSDPMVPVVMTESQIHLFLSNLTKSGLRSLLFGLCQQELIIKHSTSTEQLYSLSDMGRESCVAKFPSLNMQTMNLSLLIFKQAPPSDKGFHYLRTKCLQAKAIQLSRGNYLFSTGLPESLKVEIRKLYKDATIIFKVEAIESGFDWSTLNDSLQLWDLVSIYSGISKELTQLLTNFKEEKILTDGFKKKISELLNRFIEALSMDAGLDREGIPDRERPLFILSQLQQISRL